MHHATFVCKAIPFESKWPKVVVTENKEANLLYVCQRFCWDCPGLHLCQLNDKVKAGQLLSFICHGTST